MHTSLDNTATTTGTTAATTATATTAAAATSAAAATAATAAATAATAAAAATTALDVQNLIVAWNIPCGLAKGHWTEHVSKACQLSSLRRSCFHVHPV